MNILKNKPSKKALSGPCIEEINKIRPLELGILESELKQSAPRNALWCTKDVKVYSNSYFKNWNAVRGWITYVEEIPDNEGPDFYIWYAYELDGKTISASTKVGYDAYHWAVGEPESYNWFQKKIVVGVPVSILINPADVNQSKIYGLLEPYIINSNADTKSVNSARWAAN